MIFMPRFPARISRVKHAAPPVEGFIDALKKTADEIFKDAPSEQELLF